MGSDACGAGGNENKNADDVGVQAMIEEFPVRRKRGFENRIAAREDWRRVDGTIDFYKFKPEFLSTPEECAEITAEMDKSISHFAALVAGFRADYSETGIPTDKKLYKSTLTLWTMAQAARNRVQDRRGELRRKRNEAGREAGTIRGETRFMAAAKEMLSGEQYLAIWARANGESINIPNTEESAA
jgi:hypothetical protein